MGMLVIKDLTVDATLDAAAMKEITGGTRNSLLNAPRGGRFTPNSPFEESPLIRGLLRTRGLRGMRK